MRQDLQKRDVIFRAAAEFRHELAEWHVERERLVTHEREDKGRRRKLGERREIEERVRRARSVRPRARVRAEGSRYVGVGRAAAFDAHDTAGEPVSDRGIDDRLRRGGGDRLAQARSCSWPTLRVTVGAPADGPSVGVFRRGPRRAPRARRERRRTKGALDDLELAPRRTGYEGRIALRRARAAPGRGRPGPAWR